MVLINLWAKQKVYTLEGWCGYGILMQRMKNLSIMISQHMTGISVHKTIILKLLEKCTGMEFLNLPVKRMLRKPGSLFSVYSIQKSITRKEVISQGKKYLLKSTRASRDGCLFRRTRIMVFTCQKHLKQVRREE